ncbi:MAG: nucleotidyl transferase AbiEii/AbiGii toxin family protein [Sporichthyaceae bacterium]
MLDPAEAAAVAEQFGVTDEQVRRDHLLSQLLAVLAQRLSDTVVFFGGTALARTHLPDGRLSEDLDLLAVTQRAEIVDDVQAALATGMLREYGRLTWDPPLSAVKDTVPAVLRTHDGLTVRVQLLGPTGQPAWPTERRPLHQRYSDAPPANLAVPVRPAFAASKTAAWHDRHAPRDLYDLWGLSALGALDADAAELFARLGPTGHPPRPWMFRDPPAAADWTTQLGGQTRIAVGAAAALDVVRKAWAAVDTSDLP